MGQRLRVRLSQRNKLHSLYLPLRTFSLKKNCVYQRVSDTAVVNHTAVVYVRGAEDNAGLLIRLLPQSLCGPGQVQGIRIISY